MDKTLLVRMLRLGVRKQDVIESFIHSGGPGGQNVNKTSTCVHLRHLPTGIEVKCQRERSQVLNRRLAWGLLLEKLETARREELAAEKKRRAKIRRQTRKRSPAAKLRILEAKRRHAQKKLLRAKVRDLES